MEIKKLDQKNLKWEEDVEINDETKPGLAKAFVEEEEIDTIEAKRIEKRDSRGILDKWLGKFSSRKLLVWSVATVALYFKAIPPESWVMLSGAYIGSQAFVDLFSGMRK